jgi:hypothetical protein
LHHQAASADAVLVAKRLDGDQLFARGDFAANDPIDRAARQQFLDALGRHPRDVDVMGRLAFAFGDLDAVGDPAFEILDGFGADRKLDQMERHVFISLTKLTFALARPRVRQANVRKPEN